MKIGAGFKMQEFIIIQARMSSTRLPGKVMLPLCKKTVLEVMIKRLQVFNKNIIIATTNDGSEMPIVNLCKKLGLKYYKGDTNDVLSRYYEAGVKYGAEDDDIIVRLTSDCPLIDPAILKQCIEKYKKDGVDYLSNVGKKRTYPRGLDCEVFSFSTLQQAFFRAKSEYEREHVTPFIHSTHQGEFSISHLYHSEDNSKYRLTLDEKADYEAIQEVYKLLQCKIGFSYEELIQLLKQNPYIYEINKEIKQKRAG